MLIDIYLAVSFVVFLLLTVTVLRKIDPRSMRQTSKSERMKNLKEQFRWWWLLILIIPIVNFFVTLLRQ